MADYIEKTDEENPDESQIEYSYQKQLSNRKSSGKLASNLAALYRVQQETARKDNDDDEANRSYTNTSPLKDVASALKLEKEEDLNIQNIEGELENIIRKSKEEP